MRSRTVSGKPWTVWLLALALLAPAAAAAATVARPVPQGQDFLTESEADRIRNADSASARISLFLDFAADRLQRFQRQLQTKGTGPLHSDFLNDLLDSFSACVDAASDRVDNGMRNGMDVRAGIRDMKKRVPRFLDELKKIKAKGIELKLYEDSLNDAASDLRDDLHDAEKAQKKLQFNSPGRHGRGAGHD